MNATQDCIVLLGDSLTEISWAPGGLAQRLAENYVRKLHVINLGLSGYNSEWAIPVFEQLLSKKEEQQYPYLRHAVSLSAVQSNLRRLVNMVKSPESPYYSPSTRVVLITPPPVNTHQWAEFQQSQDPPREQDRDNDKARQYADAVKEVGAMDGIPVVDVYTPLWEAAGQNERTLSKYLSDGLHLNADGYSFVYDGLLKVIADNYPEILPDKLNTVFEIWEPLGASDKPLEMLDKRSIFPSGK
ncbi:SGNH hydrolase [Gloeophyllum trabeum ATCC 11539]|uniref:SGNH hydrolase n=1 Tax=Gloeophyllum trabeum (strain ATCC 11539 / FP-39264 / Madison 617) TaxID=670483 RepID=S7QFB9_GLOTA|nr:SGNH hydrolase [Gloeophyllum trabeum ATCC 11539]EPQ58092.1 SGNH hydrolase [Gloeophyllum trabeum ATCC 11539]